MTDLRAAAQQALEALELLQGGCTDSDDGTVEAITVWCPEVIDALRAALAEPVQEPTAWTLTKTLTERKTTTNGYLWFSNPQNCTWTPLYTAPPQRLPLTEEELFSVIRPLCADDQSCRALLDLSIDEYRAIEAKHGIGSKT